MRSFFYFFAILIYTCNVQNIYSEIQNLIVEKIPYQSESWRVIYYGDLGKIQTTLMGDISWNAKHNYLSLHHGNYDFGIYGIAQNSNSVEEYFANLEGKKFGWMAVKPEVLKDFLTTTKETKNPQELAWRMVMTDTGENYWIENENGYYFVRASIQFGLTDIIIYSKDCNLSFSVIISAKERPLIVQKELLQKIIQLRVVPSKEENPRKVRIIKPIQK